jgi:hypothetical protein
MKYNPAAAALNHVTELIEESVDSEIWRRPKKDAVYPSIKLFLDVTVSWNVICCCSSWVGTWTSLSHQ